MIISSRKEFVEMTGIPVSMVTTLLCRFQPEMKVGTNKTPTGGGAGRYYKYKIKKKDLQKMICHAYELSTITRRECDRVKWYNAYESLKSLEKGA